MKLNNEKWKRIGKRVVAVSIILFVIILMVLDGIKINNLSNYVDFLNEESQRKSDYITQIKTEKNEIEAKYNALYEKSKNIENQQSTIDSLNKQLAEQKTTIDGLNQQVADLQSQVASLNASAESAQSSGSGGHLPSIDDDSEDTSETVYWTGQGDCYHSTPDCATLKRSSNITSGSISQAGGRRPCKVCH